MTVSHERILEAFEEHRDETRIAFARIGSAIGAEHHDDKGVLVGSGLYGRVMHIETRLGGIERERDRWKRDAVVAFAVASAFVGFIVWIDADRIDRVKTLVTTPPAAEAAK